MDLENIKLFEYSFLSGHTVDRMISPLVEVYECNDV